MRKDYNLEKRKYVIGGFFVLIALIYILRLFNLQLGDSKYKIYAENNAFLNKTIYPSRGLIYDRNGELIVFNQPAYDVMMIPRDVHEFDTLDFCRTLNITPEQLRKRFQDMKNTAGYSSYTPQKLITHLSAQDYGRLQEKLYRYPGLFIQKRILRQYNHSTAANVLGNIREVSQSDIDRDPYYQPGDYCGDLGIEKSYDEHLRGVKGVEILMRDANGRIQGRYQDGAQDVEPVSGRNLKLSLDLELQQYAESLMVNKIGAVVAIEPSTGEILALVSSPTYDPRTLVGRQRGEGYRALVNDPYKPLYDRAIMACYPPGSTFKPTQGLILLEEGIINLQTTYPCAHGFISGGLRVGCHAHGSPLPLKPALQTSCNAFFCWGLKGMIDKRSKYG
ncbi:MAG: penicillin-binding protein 2, partial [Muribaculaceae bacterium]|nr:penicillin-binding protein 2 [Muribaculaceae bacterium]